MIYQPRDPFYVGKFVIGLVLIGLCVGLLLACPFGVSVP